MLIRIKGLLLMISFFTRLPFGKFVSYDDETYKKGLVMFPIVGAIIGAILAFISLWSWPSIYLRGMILVIGYVALTGGIHLDGLADACDGLFSNRDRERVLAIMKDSHIGAFGVMALILYFMSLFIGMMLLPPEWIMFMPIIGRTMAYFSAGHADYARPDLGMGKVFIDTIKPWPSSILMLAVSGITFYYLSSAGLMSAFAALGITYLILVKSKRVIGGMTGDTIGMVIEMSQIGFIFVGVSLI